MEFHDFRFRDVAQLVNGRAYLMPELQSEGKYKIVRVGNFTGKDEWFYSDMELDEDKYCYKGDLLYKWACTFGPEIWKDEKTIYHYHIWKVIPKSNFSKEFLYYYLKLYTPYWLGSTNGATMVHITKSTMENKKVFLPSYEEQCKIADILLAYDDLIENNNRRIALLEKAAQELYKEWFVRFRFPGYETTKFENGLPYRWEFKKLSQISDFVYGKMPKADLISGTGYPIFSGYRVSGYYPEYMYEDRQLVLIARGVGGTGDVKISPPKSYITNLSIVFLLKNNVYQQYLYHTYSLKNLRYLDTGAAQSQITIENLKRVKVICPEVTILEKFNGFVLDIERQIQKLLDKNQNLAKQQDLLLPRLLSGKLEV